MALPIDFEESNSVLTSPRGYPAVPPLPILRLSDGHLLSCWQLTSDERLLIPKTGRIWLSVLAGYVHPPCEIAAAIEDLVHP
jgi:hypothetical protein